MINQIHNGDVLEVMAKIPPSSVDCVITSPPYWQLRDYGYPEQWGQEETFQEYLEHLWALMDQLARVLKPEGTVWINLGDTYTRTGGEGRPQPSAMVGNQKRGVSKANCKGVEGIPDKCLLLLPHRFAIGCIDRGWIMRNDIIWAKRNNMPESVTDRFSKKHEYIFFMVQRAKYYFDLDSIKDKHTEGSIARLSQNVKNQTGSTRSAEGGYKENGNMKAVGDLNKGKNPGTISDFWDITTKGSSEKHYASFNFKLIEKPIVSGCPKGGVVLDPFCGKGTALVRALQLGRQVIGIDGSKEYCELATKNINTELNQLKMF